MEDFKFWSKVQSERGVEKRRRNSFLKKNDVKEDIEVRPAMGQEEGELGAGLEEETMKMRKSKFFNARNGEQK